MHMDRALAIALAIVAVILMAIGLYVDCGKRAFGFSKNTYWGVGFALLVVSGSFVAGGCAK